MAEFTKEALQEALVDAMMASGLSTTLEKIARLDLIITGDNETPGVMTQVALLNQSIAQIKVQGDRVEAFMDRSDKDRSQIMKTLQEMEISNFESSSNLRSETESLEASVETIMGKLTPLVEWKDKIVGVLIKGASITAGVSFLVGGITFLILNYLGFIQAVFKVMRETPQ
jgi:hypothetical protein